MVWHASCNSRLTHNPGCEKASAIRARYQYRVININKLKRFHRAASRAISGCFSSSSIPLFLSEASLPFLRVTLTHFAEWALPLPTSFPFSGLVRLGVKSRLCRSFWRAFTSTHLLMLPSTSPRKALLACLPSPPWNLPSFTVEFPLSSSCSPSDLPDSLAKMRLSFNLALSHFTIWCFRQRAVFLFLLANAALGYLPTAFSVALRPLFLFQQAQYAQVIPLKPAPFCKLFSDLCSTNKSATSLLCSSYRTLAILSSPPSFLSPQSLWQTLQELSSLSSCYIRLQWVPGHLFSQRTTRLVS